MKNFTFKIIKPTGRYRGFDNDEIIIKLNKKECGSIDYKEPHKIHFMIIKDDIMEDGNPNCVWKWVKLKNKFNSVEEAKEFLELNFDSIISKLKIRCAE